MRRMYPKKSNLKRLFSISIRRRYSEEEILKENASSETEENKPTWRCFSYDEIFEATTGFHRDNLIGRGGYAEVYKGELIDGRKIAVKRLNRALSNEQREKEFLTELGTVGHVRHSNVSPFLGCCIDFDLYLIFELSSLGSVSSHLHDENSTPIPWKIRYKISIGTARGLHYLHKGCKRRIIHRDIKASNILLTSDYEPQISDFGLAKWLPSQLTHHAVQPIEGTHGYLAPEYFTHGIVDEKTDVFAFGIFLLEVVSGRKPVDGFHQSLLSWASPFLNNGNLEMLIDPRVAGDYDALEVERLVFAASLCTRASATWRPSMSEVLDILLGEDTIRDRWKMPEEEEDDVDEDDDELWAFEDIECDTTYSSSL